MQPKYMQASQIKEDQTKSIPNEGNDPNTSPNININECNQNAYGDKHANTRMNPTKPYIYSS
jgi:hypothetical protein